jgi:hypothetical protein
MTVHAREVLGDCQRLLDVITADMPTELWKPRWAGLVALLRAVGHVLKEVDGKTSDATRKVIESAWEKLNQSKPEPAIFWKFIEDERNNILKTYEIGTRVNITLRPGAGALWLNLATGETGSGLGGPTTFEAFMRSGPFQGQDPVELCREAIAFWHGYLDAIDRQVATRQTGPAV